MNIGVSVPLPAYKVDPGFMAQTAEALGFESFWCAEHPIMPVAPAADSPGPPTASSRRATRTSSIPFVALARASGTTTPAQARHGDHARARAQPTPARQGDLDPRPVQRRAIPVRHRHRLAPRRDHDHGRGLRSSLDPDPRSDPRDEGAVDQGRGRVPRQVLRLPPGPLLPEARPEAASRRSSSAATPRRARAHRRMGRRLAPQPRRAGRRSKRPAPSSTRSPSKRAAIPSVDLTSRSSANPPTATSPAASTTPAPTE